MSKTVEFNITLKSGNDAFQDAPGSEVARILRKIAGRIDCEAGFDADDDGGPAVDANGNTVGHWFLTIESDEEPEDDDDDLIADSNAED